MNAGYLSLLFLVVSLILLASGWKDLLVRGITTKVILLFFVCWIASMQLSLVLPGARIGLWVVVLFAVIACVVYRCRGRLLKLNILSVGMLLGSVSFFLLETIHLLPSIMIGSTELSMALLIGLLVSAIFRSASVQIAVVSLGLLIGESLFRLAHREHMAFHLGSAVLQDRWWLTIYTTRGISLLIASVVLVLTRSVHWAAAGIRKRRNNGE
ncbi:hypothetical protein [Paenibacillus xerothermodurans]|uniref:Uncharacterized protein n=1 Tax=Paenibacillus xerothermodurans TaxID=1977292 RepID=A0A2W1NDD0_PAEXE|nr:hypothetical protein [Paenibacillus xerothermodurans]PZE21964.1 hypothetical protein CBW46_006080 [Paenibacillus xerothermodurans]